MAIILASASTIRQQILNNAGIPHRVIPSEVDERAVQDAVHDLNPLDVSQILADVKAVTVSQDHPPDLTIGADQVLLLNGEPLAKCDGMAEARQRLLLLSGSAHQLSTAVTLARAGEILWQHQEISTLTMHPLTPAQIGRYLAEAGEQILSSVGCYQLEAIGIRLMAKIDGDHFSILGMPIIPLLGAIASFENEGRWDGDETGSLQ